jgi:hypothetical protein
MDRDELEERIRSRRPDDAAFRRGAPVDDGSAYGDPARPAGYLPFEPEPEDVLAARESEPGAPSRYVDNTPTDFDAQPPRREHLEEPPPEAYRPHEAEPPPPAPPYSAPTSYAAPPGAPPEPAELAHAVADDEPYDQGEPEYEAEEAYPYAYSRRGSGDGRRGGGALPIIGFIALCAMALAVGAVLAGVFSSEEVAQTTPTPSASASSAAPEPSVSASTPATSEPPGASATPEPTDGPVTFPDGAIITVQACATRDMSFDGCDVDGSVVSGDLWVWIGFDDAAGSDTFLLELRLAGQTIDQQEKVLGEILDCPTTCGGYLIGAAYRDLGAGEYELVIRRNGNFADRATFTVEG